MMGESLSKFIQGGGGGGGGKLNLIISYSQIGIFRWNQIRI